MGALFSSGHYSTVASTVALVVALGGGAAYAAELIGSEDIQDGGVKRRDIARNAIDSKRVADGTLLGRDFKAGQLPAGAPGPVGPQGATGPQGPAGPRGTADLDLVYVRTGPLGADVGVTDVYLFCPDGLSPTGGGIATSGAETTMGTRGSFPFDDNIMGAGADADTIPDNGWAVEVNNDGAAGQIFAAYAVCASATYVDEEYVVVSPARTTTSEVAGRVRIVARPDAVSESGS